MYYYKLVAVNSKGTATSDVISFTTAQDPVPTVVLSAPSTTLTNAPFTIFIQFSENVTGFSSSDVVVSGATGWTKASTALEISGSYYSIQMTPSSPAPTASTITISMAANVVTDSGGQGNTIASNITVVTSATLAAPSISYPNSSYTLTYGTAVTTISPSNSGGIISSWSGTVPVGLSLDTTTGDITGTPTVVATSTSYTITATNVTGSSSYSISFTVNRRPITITATAKSKAEGDPDPSLTYLVTSGNLYSSDTLTGTLSRASGETSSGGPYAINQNTLTTGNNPNYSITFISADLTITAASSPSLAAPNISISPSTFVFPVNNAISTITPTNSGGAVASNSWAISSSLPAGLTFSTVAGTISGTPTETITATTFTITATNATSSSSASISISIVSSASAPGAPGISSVTVTGPTTVTIAFTAPVSNGGSIIDSYTAVSTPFTETFTVTQSGSGTFLITGLMANTEYSFKVRAFNAIGASEFSSPSALIRTNKTSVQLAAEAEAARQEAERVKAQQVQAARNTTLNAVKSNQPITAEMLAGSEFGISKPENFKSAISEFVARKSETDKTFNLNNPLIQNDPLLDFCIKKYAVVETITGPNPASITPTDLVKYELISADTSQKVNIVSKLKKLPPSERDSVEKINAFVQKEKAIYDARRAAVLARTLGK